MDEIHLMRDIQRLYARPANPEGMQNVNDPFAVRIDDVAEDHPLHGADIRSAPEAMLVEAAGLAILPSLERYTSHMDLSDPHGRRLAEFASSMPRRVERFLLLRRQADELTGRVPSIDDLDDLRDVVTLSFVHLMGAFDILAIVADGVVGLNSPLRDVGWQKRGFRERVRPKAPELVALVDADSEGKKTLDVVFSIRNTIHRRMPDGGSLGRYEGDPSLRHAILHFEREFHEEVLDAINAAGWAAYVGITKVGADMLIIRPDTLLLMALNRCVVLFNTIMDKTPVERLGPQTNRMPPEKSQFPMSMRRYAVKRYGVEHLTLGPSAT